MSLLHGMKERKARLLDISDHLWWKGRIRWVKLTLMWHQNIGHG
jgi:hypothetical protein